MRRASVAWERVAEVHEAADGWRRAGAIDKATARRIRGTFPDPGVTPALVWRVLTAAVVSAILLCVLGALTLAISPSSEGVRIVLFLLAALAIAATEWLEASPSWARRAAAGATPFWGGAFLLAGLALVFADGMRLDDALDRLLAAGIVVWGAACWRWGSPVFAGLAAVSLFGLLARLPSGGRVLWLVAGAALTALAARRLDHAPWAPSHRRAAAVALVAGLAAIYAAVNLYSLDTHLIEKLSRAAASGMAPPRGFVVASGLATIVVPLAVLARGLMTRRTLLVDLGIVLAALSIATLRHYVPVAPLWLALVVAGGALVALAGILERALRRAREGERHGFTADPLFSDERRALDPQVVPIVASLAPAGPAAHDKPIGGGGKFGGGGATEKF